MDAKEKAQELLDKMTMEIGKFNAKQCALVAVDEILKFMEMDDEHNECLYFANSKWVQYLMEVKQELEKL